MEIYETIVAVKFLVFFLNYDKEVGGTSTLLVPQPKVGGPVSPVPTVVAPMHVLKS